MIKIKYIYYFLLLFIISISSQAGFNLYAKDDRDIFPLVINDEIPGKDSRFEQEFDSRRFTVSVNGNWIRVKILLRNVNKNISFADAQIDPKYSLSDIKVLKAPDTKKLRKSKAKLADYISYADLKKSRFSFSICDYKNGFYLLKINRHSKRSKNETIKLWIHEEYFLRINRYSTYFDQVKNEQHSVQTISFKSNAIFKSLDSKPFSNRILFNKIFLKDILHFSNNVYASTNCGIYGILSTLVLAEPSIVHELVKEKNVLIQRLEELSKVNNFEIFMTAAKCCTTATCLITPFLTVGNSIDSGLVLSLGMGMAQVSKHAVSDYFREFLRKNFGIGPQRLELLGNEFLRDLKMDHKFKFELASSNDFDQMILQWKARLKRGLPVIALLRDHNFHGHYVTVVRVSKNKDIYVTDENEGTIKAFSYEHAKMRFDARRSNGLAATSTLAGIDSPFTYIYLETVE